MKKVKIMLLSLALFAVVGGALAFKAKLGPNKFCTVDAYWNNSPTNPQYYCSFDQGGGLFTTTVCDSYRINITTTNSGVQKVCTTTTNGANSDLLCQTLTCPNITSIKADQ